MTVENTEHYVVLTAEEGNVFRSKLNGYVLSGKIYLGCNDSADNYEEISEGEVYADIDTEGQIAEESE